jgi:signal transduction histidine kinase/CheY-like chemotaxis protein
MSPYSRWSSFRASFQFKLFLVFTFLTFVIVSILSTLYIVTENHSARRMVTEQLQLRAKQLGDAVRMPLYAENIEALRQMAGQAARMPDIHAVVISGSGGKILAEVFAPGHAASHSSAEIISRTAEVYSNHLVDSVESSIAGGRDDAVVLIGTVRLERETDDLSRNLNRVILLAIGSATGFWLAVSLLCHLVLRRAIRSFNILVNGIDAMQGGDLSFRFNIDSNDEPGRVARAINDLASALQRRNEENATLQEERLDFERQLLQTQKLESLGVMAGGIAHDYNNLLQSILGNIELASLKLNPDSPTFKYITNAMTSGKHAAQLTNLMLTYVGKGLIAKKALNLNELVRENAEMLKTAASTAVEVELYLAEDLADILADEANIQQLIMNLIINAAESIMAQPGFVRLTTGVMDYDQTALAASLLDEKPSPGSFVFLEVRDNGCGMNAETLRRLFDPFFTTKFTGRGLGMSAVMGIIRSHGGALFVDSEPGRGTVFRVLLPVVGASVPREPVQPGMNLSIFPESALPGIALVVDDEKAVLRICRKMLEHCGYSVITACDGVDAVAKFREHGDDIAIVLMDLTMPNMDGITAMGEIIAIRPDARVIISSGYNKEELTDRFSSGAPSGFIRKPYSLKVLESEIRRVMQAD